MANTILLSSIVPVSGLTGRGKLFTANLQILDNNRMVSNSERDALGTFSVVDVGPTHTYLTNVVLVVANMLIHG